MDYYGFYTGTLFDAYEYLGAHVKEDGVIFRTFAPAASKIAVIGEWNNWEEMEMNRVYNGAFFELEVKEAKAGQLYKYKIYGNGGRAVEHCDPYGYGMELRPQFASVIRDLNAYEFHDEKWLRKRTDRKNEPLNIYEMHLGSWRNNKEDENGWYHYSELADILIPYLKEMGYNYIELLPVAEHPSDNSWGYQLTGYYAPTSRYGTMDDYKSFIDKCHQNGIGIIMDFVPVHFAVDAYGLREYDGTYLYEFPHPDVGNSEWGSINFNHSRGEVRSFLQSNIMYWLKEYHIDGIRMDAISNMIYWQGDKNRGVNNGAVEFIRKMNKTVKEKFPSVILAAEDSTSFPDVTKPAEEGGLGFDYKWDMGWMNDTLDYFKKSPAERRENYHKLTFSMMYYFGENYLMPLSHDEVVHGKATIAQKMYGDYEQKFPQLRAMYMYMYAHPGKKLNFMGNELAQLREWDEKREQDWLLLDYPVHSGFYGFMKGLNHVYLEHKALSEQDFEQSGFEWLDCHQEDKCIYAFERKSREGKERIVAVFNFSDAEYQDFPLEIREGNKLVKLYSAYQDEEEEIEVTSGRSMVNLKPFDAKYYIVK